MIEFAALPELVQATLVVSAILAQAVILYVGYGILERITAPLIESIVTA